MHIHTSEDPKDGRGIKYSAKEIIDFAASKGFEILSITNHDNLFYNEDIAKYAESKGILLIPGIEKTLYKKHILLYNVSQEEADSVVTFEDLEKIKKPGNLIVAAHPFFPTIGLGKKFLQNVSLFDGIEYSSFCCMVVNFNKKAVEVAKENNKPIIGNSDLHIQHYFNRTYSMIDSDKDVASVISAIKNRKVNLVTNPMDHLTFLKAGLWSTFNGVLVKTRKLFKKESFI